MGFYHAHTHFREFRVCLDSVNSFVGIGRIVNTVSTVNFFGDKLDSLFDRHIQFIEEFEFSLVFTGFNNGVGEFDSTVATFLPMSGQGNTGTFSLTQFANFGNFRIGIGVEGIDTDNRG